MSDDEGARVGAGGLEKLASALAVAWRTIMLVVMGMLGVATLIALIVTLGEANRQRDRALALQSHSYDVMILARSLSSTIARSEASLGRYVISTDKQLGRLYYEEWRLAGEQVARLDQITHDNPTQREEVDRLRAAYYARGTELSLTALSTNYGKNNQALSRYYQARKAPSLATINETLDRIIRGERALLETRTTVAMASVDRSTRAAFVFSVFGILLVVGAITLGWLAVQAQAERKVAQDDADSERERAEHLAFAVAAATAELREQEGRLRQVQKMEAVGQLTGGIAHDFNNMLAVVLGGLELARRNASTSVMIRHIDNATDGANRAAALTRQLLAFAREDAINPEAIEVGGLIAGMTDLLDRTLGDAVTVKVIDDSDAWRVRADRVQMENMLLNLAVNARDAMDGRGTITIRASSDRFSDQRDDRAPGDYLVIAVSDTGCGMAPDVLERAFEPFYTTKAVGKGTGLGLSQIFSFVRQLGGTIGIDSMVGRGTTVTLFLPRDASTPIVATKAEVATPAAAPSSAPLLVLVVEDDPRVLAATLGALEELGHQAIPCPDPLSAPRLLTQHPDVDLIVSDVLMPGQTGPEMIAALGPEHAHLAVLFVTGFAGEGGEFGGRQVLRKPFTLAGLERAVAAAAAADRPAAPDRLAAE